MLTFEKPLLVMSVFAKSLIWFNYQKEFLDKTTINYVHAICLNNVDEQPKAIIIDKSNSNDEGAKQHLKSLQILAEYAKSKRHEYRGFMILDSDCFPIDDWEVKLNDKINDYKLCAAVRLENFDTFAHPSIIYTQNPDLLVFDKIETYNLLGQKIIDNACMVKKFFPLVRTNRLNVHPLASGIYYDRFYHHCAGSRKFVTRSDDYYNRTTTETENFFKNPNEFINRLRGENVTS